MRVAALLLPIVVGTTLALAFFFNLPIGLEGDGRTFLEWIGSAYLLAVLMSVAYVVPSCCFQVAVDGIRQFPMSSIVKWGDIERATIVCIPGLKYFTRLNLSGGRRSVELYAFAFGGREQLEQCLKPHLSWIEGIQSATGICTYARR